MIRNIKMSPCVYDEKIVLKGDELNINDGEFMNLSGAIRFRENNLNLKNDY